MPTFLAPLAADWIEHTLFPIAIAAARLPEETTPDDVCNLQLPQPDHAFAGHSNAVMHCSNLLLVSATLIATELAQHERTSQIAQGIMGLLWRDALDLATARDLDFDTGISGFPTAEFQQRHDEAQVIWARWQATDPQVRHAITSFFAVCGDAWDDDVLAWTQARASDRDAK